MRQVLGGRVYGCDHDEPNPGPLSSRTYATLVGEPLDGLLLDITGFTAEELDGGVALATELSRWPGGRALYDPGAGEPCRPGPGIVCRFRYSGDRGSGAWLVGQPEGAPGGRRAGGEGAMAQLSEEERFAQWRIVATVCSCGVLDSDGLAMWREADCGEWKATAAEIGQDLDQLQVPYQGDRLPLPPGQRVEQELAPR